MHNFSQAWSMKGVTIAAIAAAGAAALAVLAVPVVRRRVSRAVFGEVVDDDEQYHRELLEFIRAELNQLETAVQV
jgi:hypothetical protein